MSDKFVDEWFMPSSSRSLRLMAWVMDSVSELVSSDWRVMEMCGYVLTVAILMLMLVVVVVAEAVKLISGIGSIFGE